MNSKRTAGIITLAAVVLLVAVGGTALAGGMPSIDPSIIGEWRWTGASTPVGNIGPLPGQTYTITFREDGTMTMAFEANTVNGTFTADGTTVAIEPAASTRASWLPGSPAPRLIELLSEARAYEVSDASLELETLRGTGSINFERVN